MTETAQREREAGPHENSTARRDQPGDRLPRQTVDLACVREAQPRARPAPGRLARERLPPHGLTGPPIERQRRALLRLAAVSRIERQHDARRVRRRQCNADRFPSGICVAAVAIIVSIGTPSVRPVRSNRGLPARSARVLRLVRRRARTASAGPAAARGCSGRRRRCFAVCAINQTQSPRDTRSRRRPRR